MNCCDDPNIIESNGFYTCNNCGICGDKIIIDSVRYIRRKDLSPYNSVLKHKEIVQHKYGNRTIMNRKEARETGFMNRLWHINRQDYKETGRWSMKYSIPIFNTVCYRMGIVAHVKEFAWKVYKNYTSSKKNLAVEEGIGAVLYISSKFHNMDLHIDELIDILNISRDKLLLHIEKISRFISQ